MEGLRYTTSPFALKVMVHATPSTAGQLLPLYKIFLGLPWQSSCPPLCPLQVEVDSEIQHGSRHAMTIIIRLESIDRSENGSS